MIDGLQAVTSHRLRCVVWCFWGAALAATPCTLRSITALVFAPHLYYAPAQYPLPALCVLLVLLVVTLTLARRPELARIPNLLIKLVPFGAVFQIVVLLCELGWMPMRMGSLALLDYQPLFDLVGGASIVASGLCWSWLGALLARSGDNESSARQTAAPAFVTTFLSAALFPILAQTLGPIYQGLTLASLCICVLSGVPVLALCLHCLKMGYNRDSLLMIEVCLIGGLSLASAFQEGAAALIEVWLSSPSATIEDTGAAALFLLPAYIAFSVLLLVTALLIMRKSRQATAPVLNVDTGSPLSRLRGASLLSNRQREVLTLLAQGNSLREIADKLGISVGTASTHQSRGLERLGIESTCELVKKLDELARRDSAELQRESHSKAHTKMLVDIVGGIGLALLPVLWPDGSLLGRYVSYVICSALVCVSLALLVSMGMRPHLDKLWPQASSLHIATALCVGALAGVYTSTGILPMSWSVSFALLTAMILRQTLLRMASYRTTGCAEETQSYCPAIVSPLFLLLYGAAALASSHIAFGSNPGLLSFVVSFACLALIVKTCLDQVAQLRSLNIENPSSPTDERCVMDALLHEGLSETEARIALLTARGYTRPQICGILNVAAGTVNSSRASSYAKLQVHTAGELKERIDKTAGKRV